jgi:acyl dehydratase
MNDELAEYTFDEIEIGLTKQFQITITESMIDDFAKISGDYNPLHMDEKFAQSRDFKNRVCHGMLLGSLFSRLVGMYVPGKYGLYFSQTLNFVNPTTVNDTVTVTGKVISKNESTKIIKLKTTIKNSSHVLVDGEAKVILSK